MKYLLILGLGLGLLLAACGGSDSSDGGGGSEDKGGEGGPYEYSEEVKGAYLESCVTGAEESRPDWSSLQASEYCTCSLYEMQARWSEEYCTENMSACTEGLQSEGALEECAAGASEG